MASLHHVNVDRPVESIQPSSLPDVCHDDLANGLTALVDHSAHNTDVTQNIHAPMHSLMKVP